MQIPKGLFDILPYGTKYPWQSVHLWQYLEQIIKNICYAYNYEEIRTPMFERTEVFVRSVGPTSDIVSKEMYTFEDRAKRSMSLKPEGTAPVVRSFIEKRLMQLKSYHKFFYISPMFRYDRPQSGRYRQFHQFGVEVFGNKSVEQDAEIIDMLYQFLKELQIKNLNVQINSIGDEKARGDYKKALKQYLEPHLNSLSKESQERLIKNPLRILDSKEKEDQPFIEKAPSILEFLSNDSENHFNKLLELLKLLKIPFKVNPHLVRGLDYYNDVVFEVTSKELGSQTALGGGGRFDTLLSQFKGPNIPATGFATGIERIIQTMLEQNVAIPEKKAPFVFFIPLDKKAKEISFLLTSELRHLHIPTEIDLKSKKISGSLQTASELKVNFAVIIGEDELNKEVVVIKNLTKRQQREIRLSNFKEEIIKLWEIENGKI